MKKFIISTVLSGLLFATGINTKLSKTIPDENTVLVNQEYIDSLSKGWNLIGVEHTIDNLSETFKNTDIVWIYNNEVKKFYAYTNSNFPDIRADIEESGYLYPFSFIPAGSGIWVYRKIDLPEFKYFDYEILDKNENEVKVRLKINISLPQNDNLFYVTKAYDNNKEIELSFLPPLNENYSIADINLTRGLHKITICQGVGSADFSPATIRYNVCKSIDIGTDLPDFNDYNEYNNTLYNFYGSVVDEYNSTLSGVDIVLQLPDKNITSTTDINGNYDLKIDENITFPVLLTATKEGYIPQSVNVYKNDSTDYKINFQLSEKQDNVVIIDKNLHHLGDDYYSGTINSQFQAKSEGLVYVKKFNLSKEFLDTYHYATLYIYVKGAQVGNELIINNIFIGRLDKSPSDGSFGRYMYKVSFDRLKEENTLVIKSVKTYSGDYDDFEFANIQLKAK